MSGNGHKYALELEKAKPVDQRIIPSSVMSQSTSKQKRIDVMQNENSKEAYMKLARTAYELAMNPTMPIRQFKTLVKVQRQNGVRLIDGK